MQIDENQRGKLSKVDDPVAFNDGHIRGWKVKIPGGHPLATPAVADGRVFIGGGFGSYEHYAFEGNSGRLIWQYQTSDDGPTSAVVEDGYVVFNTESCELEVLTVEGKPVWKHWLGDPLMSTPAVADGRIFMAFPDSNGDALHYLACFDLKTGRENWRQRISGEIMTAPTLSDGRVYFATLDGSVYCFVQKDGQRIWKRAAQATSSPAVAGGKCYYSQRESVAESSDGESKEQQYELFAAIGEVSGVSSHNYRSAARKADYLDYGKRSASSDYFADCAASDTDVGFGSTKGHSNIEQAMRHLGRGHVSEIWAYQGSRPFVSEGRLYSSLGDAVCCAAMETDEIIWKTRVREQVDENCELLDNEVTPPALVNGKVFCGTMRGEVICLAALSGEELWRVNVGEPIVCQPCVAEGRVFVATHHGSLYGLETGDPGDDGWRMWGATGAHNGLHELEQLHDSHALTEDPASPALV